MLKKIFSLVAGFVALTPLFLVIVSSQASQGIKTLTVCSTGCAFNKIQVAIDAAAAGDTVVVSTGVYREFVRVKKPLALISDGAVTLRPSAESSLPQALVILDDATDMRLSGFTIIGSALAGVLVSGGSALIENNTIIDNALGVLITDGATATVRQNKIEDGISVRNKSVLMATKNTIREGTSDGVAFVNSTGTLKENEISRFEGNGVSLRSTSSATLAQNAITLNKASGIEASDASEVTIEANQINQNDFSGISLLTGKGKIVNNQVNTNEWGVRVGGSAEIRDNRIEKSRFCALWADATAQIIGNMNKLGDNGAELCGPMPASLRQPTAEQTNRTQVNVPGDFKTIQEAVDAVAPDGTVTIGAGIFSGPIGIYKNVTIQGTSGSILDGAKKITLAIAADAKKVSLQNLTVRGGLVGIRIEAGAPETSIMLNQVTVTANELDGIQVRSTAFVSVQKSNLLGNSINCLGLTGCAALSVGRRSFFDGLAQTSGRLQLLDSTIKANEHSGVTLSDAALSTIENSAIEQNKRNGIELVEGAQAQIKNVSFVQNDVGLWAIGKTKLTLNGVKLSEQRADGIRVDGKEAQADIVASESRQNKGHGLLAQTGAQVSVKESKFLSNGQLGLFSKDAGKLSFEKVTVMGNALGGVSFSGKENITLVQSEVVSNKGTGIQVTGAMKIEIKETVISSNESKGADGIALYGSVQGLLQGNRITGNGRNGIVVAEKILADLRNNQISNNILWGVATYTKHCIPDDAQIPDQFNGVVSGSGNDVDGNLKGALHGRFARDFQLKLIKELRPRRPTSQKR